MLGSPRREPGGQSGNDANSGPAGRVPGFLPNARKLTRPTQQTLARSRRAGSRFRRRRGSKAAYEAADRYQTTAFAQTHRQTPHSIRPGGCVPKHSDALPESRRPAAARSQTERCYWNSRRRAPTGLRVRCRCRACRITEASCPRRTYSNALCVGPRASDYFSSARHHDLRL